jgi:hypothetical protein
MVKITQTHHDDVLICRKTNGRGRDTRESNDIDGRTLKNTEIKLPTLSKRHLNTKIRG